MFIIDRILYLSEEFKKLAEVNLTSSNFKTKLDLMLDKNLPNEEIEYWHNLNQNILNEYNIKSIKDYHLNYQTKNIYKVYMIPSTGTDFTIILSQDSTLKDDYKYEIKSTSFLKGYKHIPNLYLFKVENSGFNYEPIKIEFAHDEFIIKALEKITGISYHSRIYYKIFDFIKENREIINKIRTMFSYTPKIIGKGDDGIAYDIGKNLVLKIFQDSYSFNKAKESIETLYKNPELAKTEAMIYDLGVIGNIENKTVYYYIMEKVKPISNESFPELSFIVNFIASYIKKNPSDFENIKKEIYKNNKSNDIKKIIDNIANNIDSFIKLKHEDIIKAIEANTELKSDWLKNLCEEIIFKYLTGRGDLHMGNIGVTNYGNFKYFDPSHGDWENDLNTPSRDSVDYALKEMR